MADEHESEPPSPPPQDSTPSPGDEREPSEAPDEAAQAKPTEAETAEGSPAAAAKDKSKSESEKAESKKSESKKSRSKGKASAPSDPETRRRERRSNLIWFGSIFVILCIELYIFGKNGLINVCVGRPYTDFSLIGAQVTPQNRLKMPTCELRFNIGMSNKYDETVKQAHLAACQRATLRQGIKGRTQCLSTSEGWRKYIVVEQAYPWQKPFYERLFWFFY